jgi:hypothetical protein
MVMLVGFLLASTLAVSLPDGETSYPLLFDNDNRLQIIAYFDILFFGFQYSIHNVSNIYDPYSDKISNV